jgi:hypothetical protein
MRQADQSAMSKNTYRSAALKGADQVKFFSECFEGRRRPLRKSRPHGREAGPVVAPDDRDGPTLLRVLSFCRVESAEACIETKANYGRYLRFSCVPLASGRHSARPRAPLDRRQTADHYCLCWRVGSETRPPYPPRQNSVRKPTNRASSRAVRVRQCKPLRLLRSYPPAHSDR